ncbi:MAG TPA: hypothetical protein VGD87_08895, partial [Archangium sp.]
KIARGELMGGTVLIALKSKNASASSYAMAVQGLNDKEFTCALEGTDFDGDCPKSTAATRSKIIQNTANATRQAFNQFGPASSIMSDQNFNGPAGAKVPKDQLSSGNWTHFFMSSARVGEGTSSGSRSSAQTKTVGAQAVGGVLVLGYKHTPVAPGPIFGDIYSGQQNKHSGIPGVSYHQGQHRDFEGMWQADPCSEKNCFVNFNADKDADNDFGQPTVYGGVTQSLRMRADKSGSSFTEGAPWEISSSGEVAITMVDGKPAKIKLIPRGEGIAVSKAKTYFHQMGNWKVSPNFFDPFWRAKLHFFKKQELTQVLTTAGDMNGVMMLNAGGPVEGEDQ